MNYYHKCKGLEAHSPVVVQNIKTLVSSFENIYELVNVVGKRANQMQSNIKEEFYEKKEEFASYTDSVEDFQENPELIEISKAYECLPNCTNLSIKELEQDKIFYRYPEKEENLLFS